MKRVKVNPKKDRKVFSQTASNTKKINIAPRQYRGGIRL